MFKVKNKDTLTTPMASFGVFIVNFVITKRVTVTIFWVFKENVSYL